MSDHFTTELRRRDKAVAALRDLASRAEIYGMTHDAYCTAYNEILERCKIKKAPQWVRAYLEGVRDQISQDRYRHHLMFGGMVDGKFYSTHSERADYYEKHGISAREYSDDGKVTARGYYWSKTGRPFYLSKP